MRTPLKLLIIRDVPSAGRSKIAKQLVKSDPVGWKRVSKSEIRKVFLSSLSSTTNDEIINTIRDFHILEGLKNAQNVIVDDVNITEFEMEALLHLVNQYSKQSSQDVEVEIMEYAVSLIQARSTEDSHRKEMKAKRDPKYAIQDKSLTPAIICDLDGTLALMNGRNPFDGAKCESDLLNEPVADIVKTYSDKGASIILLSGRTDNYKEHTERWLAKYKIPYDLLLMRARKDSRKDSIVKTELVDKYIKGKYYVKFVLDDRNQVVDMWRKEIGYPCLQVYYGDF